MTVEELYARIGGNYAEVLGRLRMDKLVSRFIVRFLDDTSCADLIRAWHDGDEDAAFHAAHAAKGVCGNLALTRLGALSDEICEALRKGHEELRAQTDIDALVAEFEPLYARTVEGIKEFQAAQ